MKKDEQGWGGRFGAPAATYWHCPECNCNSAVADWKQGDGDTRACPLCSHAYTPGGEATRGTAGRISEADSADPKK